MSVSRQSIEIRAEILKLARLLGRPPDELAYLEAVGVGVLQALREQVTETLFDSHMGALSRMASASRILPVGVVAQMGEKVFGPLLSARITGLLDPDRAVEVAARLPDGFLADVAVELDPRRASQVIARIPADRIAAITRELLARGEYVTMGRFVGHLPDASLRAAVDVSGPDDLLQVALVLENKDRLGDLLDMLGPERTERILEAADRADLGPEARTILEQAAG
jgi:muconolactone delta-isomerase